MNEPIIIPCSQKEAFKIQIAKYSIQNIHDDIDEQLSELFEIENPNKAHNYSTEDVTSFVKNRFNQAKESIGNWIIFPWNYTATRLLDESDFIKLRTSRNRYIINEKEQLNYFNTVIGVAGLSVGSSIATTLILTGGCKHIKISDRDTLAPTNLNRIPVGVHNLGLNKTQITARRIYEMNPYAIVEQYSDGITDENIDDFLEGLNPVTLLFEEIDNIKIKYDFRIKARKLKIPVVMITDNGDNVMVDIERFDLGDDKIFYGLIEEDEAQEIFSRPVIDPQTRMMMSLKIIGAATGVPRMQNSLLEVGRSLPSWPQLGTATTLTGAVGAYIARKICNNEELAKGRLHISLDSNLIPDYNSEQSIQERLNHTNKFVKQLSDM